jgi:Tfp pilus assembly protein PilF
VVKRIVLVGSLAALLWSCASVEVLAPDVYFEALPATATSRMSLEERVTAEEAWRELRAGRAAQAVKRLERLDQTNPAFYAGLGFAGLLRNDLATAEQDFTAAVEIAPDIVLGHVGLAQVYERTGREDLAFTQYQEILKREPDHPWAQPRFTGLKERKTVEWLKTGSAARESDDTESAKKALLTALFYSPESLEAHLGLSQIYRQEDNLPSALLHLEAALQARPDDTGLLRDYAETLYAAEQYGKSLDVFEKLAGLDPRDQAAAGRLAELKEKMGVVEIPSRYNEIAAAEALTREDLAALIAIKFKADFGRREAKPPIIVDIATSWAARFILQTTSFGVLDVYENHTFYPQKTVHRAELAQVLARLIDFLKSLGHPLIPQLPRNRIQLADVPPDNFYREAILQVVAYQVMELSPQRAFQPEAAVSGAEAVRALDILRALTD